MGSEQSGYNTLSVCHNLKESGIFTRNTPHVFLVVSVGTLYSPSKCMCVCVCVSFVGIYLPAWILCPFLIISIKTGNKKSWPEF